MQYSTVGQNNPTPAQPVGVPTWSDRIIQQIETMPPGLVGTAATVGVGAGVFSWGVAKGKFNASGGNCFIAFLTTTVVTSGILIGVMAQAKLNKKILAQSAVHQPAAPQPPVTIPQPPSQVTAPDQTATLDQLRAYVVELTRAYNLLSETYDAVRQGYPTLVTEEALAAQTAELRGEINAAQQGLVALSGLDGRVQAAQQGLAALQVKVDRLIDAATLTAQLTDRVNATQTRLANLQAPQQNEQTGNKWAIPTLIGTGILASIVATVVVVKNKKTKPKAQSGTPKKK